MQKKENKRSKLSENSNFMQLRYLAIPTKIVKDYRQNQIGGTVLDNEMLQTRILI